MTASTRHSTPGTPAWRTVLPSTDQYYPVQTCIASGAQPNTRLMDGVPSSSRNKTKHVSQRQMSRQQHCCPAAPTHPTHHNTPAPTATSPPLGLQRQEVTTAITHPAPSRLMSVGTVTGHPSTVTAILPPQHPCPYPSPLILPWVPLGACCKHAANTPSFHQHPKLSMDPLSTWHSCPDWGPYPSSWGDKYLYAQVVRFVLIAASLILFTDQVVRFVLLFSPHGSFDQIPLKQQTLSFHTSFNPHYNEHY